MSAGGNYNITYIGATLTINKKTLTITADDKSKVYGGADPAFTVNYTGFITGEDESSLGGTLSLTRAAGENVGTYAITPAGLTSANYDITFVNGTLTIVSNNALLSDLTLNSSTLSPAFVSGTTSYTASVGDSMSSITVTPTADDANATITVNGMAVTSGEVSGPISLSVGPNTINVVVTAQDAVTTKTYTVTVNRASYSDESDTTEEETDTLVMDEDSVEKETSTTDEGKTIETFTVKGEVQEQITQAKTEGKTSIVISVESNQEATTVVQVAADVLRSTTGMNVAVVTPNATLELPTALVEALAAAGQGLSLTVERGNAGMVADEMSGVPEAAGAEIVGTPTEINTSIQGSTTVTLPLTGITLPDNTEERAVFLESLAIFAIHSDGEKKVIAGTINYDANGNPTSISFAVDKFSTFTVIKTPAVKKQIRLTIGRLDSTVDGKPYTMDAAPFINQLVNRTLVPVRFVSEMLKANVEWLPETKQVRITDNGRAILLTIDSEVILVDGEEKKLDCPAEIVSMRAFVPLRFISETLGASVLWNGANKTITIRR